MQEQQRLAREEQKKREIEIQKRKLKSINVANPTSSASLSFDDLVTLKPSSSPKSSPRVTRQGQSAATPNTTVDVVTAATRTERIAPSTVNDPLPTGAISNVGVSLQAAATTGQVHVTQAPPIALPDNTFEKLMESSLSNLKDTSPGRSRKMDFRSSTSGTKQSPLINRQQKTFSESEKARTWMADGGEFSGLFSQHRAGEKGASESQGDDSFGEFQSVGAPPAIGQSTVVGHSQVSNQGNRVHNVHVSL